MAEITSMRVSLLFVAAITVIPAVVLLGGCAAPMTVRGGDRTSPTGGIAIVFQENDVQEMRFRRFELDADGTLRAGGGRSAQRMTTDWSGAATAEQISAIVSAAKSANLESGDIACNAETVGGNQPVRTTIEYAWPDGRRRLDLVGDCPSLAPLREAFDAAARIRFRQQLDQLPEAGLQPRR